MWEHTCTFPRTLCVSALMNDFSFVWPLLYRFHAIFFFFVSLLFLNKELAVFFDTKIW
jgi:hypothetical protein